LIVGRDPTGSRLARVIACPASSALPQVDDLEPQPAASRGTKIHRYLQRVSEVGSDAALAEVAALNEPELLSYCETIDIDELPVDLAAEVAFAWNWSRRTGRELGRGIDRAYTGLGPTEVGLTTDVLGVDRKDRRVFIGDYKSGRLWVGRPRENAQLMSAAAAACSVFDADEAVVEVIYLDDDGVPRRFADVVTAWELETFGDDLEAAMQSAIEARMVIGRGGTPNVAAGSHCRYCSAYRNCPAQTALVRAAVTALQPGAGAPFTSGFLAPDRLAATWRQVQAFRIMLGRVESEVLALASREPIDLGDGKVLGPVETARETIEADTTYTVLEARYGRAAADRAMTRKTSKAAVRTVATAYKPPKAKLSTRNGDGELDRILDEIRARGGAKVRRGIRPKETTADKLAPGYAVTVAELLAPDEASDGSDMQEDFG